METAKNRVLRLARAWPAPSDMQGFNGESRLGTPALSSASRSIQCQSGRPVEPTLELGCWDEHEAAASYQTNFGLDIAVE